MVRIEERGEMFLWESDSTEQHLFFERVYITEFVIIIITDNLENCIKFNENYASTIYNTLSFVYLLNIYENEEFIE